MRTNSVFASLWKMSRRFAGMAAGLTVAILLAGGWASSTQAAVEGAPGGGVLFTYSDPYAGTVAVAGNFNEWNTSANPMTKGEAGVWSTVVKLGPGEYEYKFVVDGQWIADPDNPVTVGDYGNSALKVGEDGKIVKMQATSNTELSPKVFLGSRYIVLMQERETQDANPSWNFDRPNFDVDLDFNIRVNEDLTAHILTNINNQNQNVQLWETNMVFDRGSMRLDNEDIHLTAFDNDSVSVWNDPLHLVGNIGIYHHPWGFDQQGVLAWKQFGRYRGRALYSDNFRTGGDTNPPVDPLLESVGSALAKGSAADLRGSTRYSFVDNDNDKDVLALRVEGPVAGENLTGGLSYRLDRGFNPGAYVEVLGDSVLGDGGHELLVNSYPKTVEHWQGGGADFRYFNDPAGIELHGEFLVGENWISTGHGDRQEITYSNLNPQAGTADRTALRLGAAAPTDTRLNTSKRFVLGGHYFAYRGWHWKGGVEFQDADLADPSREGGDRYNRMTVYRASVAFDGQEWKEWPWEADLALEYTNFSYGDRSRWLDQFWFDATNFWLEQGEHLVTVDRLVMLGGDDVVSWRPHARWMFYAPRNASVEYWGKLNSTRLDRKPKYWENQIAFHLDLTRRIGLNTDSRIVRYDDPVLNLRDTFDSHFVEFKYKFTPDMEIGLSWGVDPLVIDGPTNEYAHIGRDVFLFDRGANGSAAQARFLDLTETIRRAEQELEDEKRVQLEAILKF